MTLTKSRTTDVDARGLVCPLPVLRARKALMDLPGGALVRLLADDPVAVIDVPHYCAEMGHDYLGLTEHDDGQEHLIRKGAH